jgi:flagellar hook-associated protein 3 FlgL
MFTTVQNLVTALQQNTNTPSGQTQLNNSVNSAINNIDQALTQSQNVQSSVGARLNSITTQQAGAASQQVQLKQTISNLQSLDYPTAITSLDSQQTTLSAAMQAFTLTQGLSLFKYIQ